MRLSNFITTHLDLILVDWVTFARAVIAPVALDEKALLDHGKLILEEIAADMLEPQREDERQAKSEGDSATASTSRDLPSRSHARQRERQGFDVEQMVSEYRALRATVLRLWTASTATAHTEDLEDVVRFNEAVDQAVAESLTAFMAEVGKTKDLFIGVLGHDLRGPLSTITTCATVLRAAPQNERSVAMILRSAAQMKALLDDLVEYTGERFGAELTVHPVALRLHEFVRQTLDEIGAIHPARVIQLDAKGDLQGKWDPRRLHQAVSNLVFNALKYGLQDQPVRVRLDGSGPGEVVLTVANEGRVIPADMLARIFDPLVRAEEEPTQEAPSAGANLGLGLYVVRLTAQAHGGTVTVTSEDGITCFEVRLPRVCRSR